MVRGTPANPQKLNRFSYVNNNPTNFIDPDGREQIYDTGAYFSVDFVGLLLPALPPYNWLFWEWLFGSGPEGSSESSPVRGSGGFFPTDIIDNTIWWHANNPCVNAQLPAFDLLLDEERDILGAGGGGWGTLSDAQRAAYLNIVAAMRAANILQDSMQVDWQRGIRQDRVFLFTSGDFDAGFLERRGFTRDPLSFITGRPSYRQDVRWGSLEVTFNATGIDVDIDYFNPLFVPQFSDHQREVNQNQQTGSLTNPFAVFSILNTGLGRPGGIVRPQYQCTPIPVGGPR